MGYLIAAAAVFAVGFGSGYSSAKSTARRRVEDTARAFRDMWR